MLPFKETLYLRDFYPRIFRGIEKKQTPPRQDKTIEYKDAPPLPASVDLTTLDPPS